MEEAVKSFSEINKALVEDGIPYEKLIELVKQELEKDPKTVAKDLLDLIKPASCLQVVLSWLGRK